MTSIDDSSMNELQSYREPRKSRSDEDTKSLLSKQQQNGNNVKEGQPLNNGCPSSDAAVYTRSAFGFFLFLIAGENICQF